jgi:hypothetical protein
MNIWKNLTFPRFQQSAPRFQDHWHQVSHVTISALSTNGVNQIAEREMITKTWAIDKLMHF